jgi:hypothetical protein
VEVKLLLLAVAVALVIAVAVARTWVQTDHEPVKRERYRGWLGRE